MVNAIDRHINDHSRSLRKLLAVYFGIFGSLGTALEVFEKAFLSSIEVRPANFALEIDLSCVIGRVQKHDV